MLRRFAWGVLAFTLFVIVWGTFVRATGSGAGCGSHWPTCNGEVIPRPETVETAIEFTHRATSGLSFILVAAMMIAALRLRPKGHPMRRAAVLSFVFMITESAVGAGLVLLEYVADDRSPARAIWVAVHLINTFLLVASIALAARQSGEDARPLRWRPIGIWVLLAAAAVLFVATAGAVTALGDTLFPARSLAEGVAADFSPTAHFLIRLRIYHPLSAMGASVLITAVALIVGLRVPGARKPAMTLIALFFLQIGGGLVNLFLLAPVWMQLVHLALADAVWIALVLLGVEAFGTPRAARAGGNSGRSARS
ncbi:MAG: COX15/CtaA family protein [Myxococcales bacterium]|nr:COX15/CtaA family protein [Myxococcales bacterium]